MDSEAWDEGELDFWVQAESQGTRVPCGRPDESAGAQRSAPLWHSSVPAEAVQGTPLSQRSTQPHAGDSGSPEAVGSATPLGSPAQAAKARHAAHRAGQSPRSPRSHKRTAREAGLRSSPIAAASHVPTDAGQPAQQTSRSAIAQGPARALIDALQLTGDHATALSAIAAAPPQQATSEKLLTQHRMPLQAQGSLKPAQQPPQQAAPTQAAIPACRRHQASQARPEPPHSAPATTQSAWRGTENSSLSGHGRADPSFPLPVADLAAGAARQTAELGLPVLTTSQSVACTVEQPHKSDEARAERRKQRQALLEAALEDIEDFGLKADRLRRHRPRGLRVTDLVAAVWCQQQLAYTLSLTVHQVGASAALLCVVLAAGLPHCQMRLGLSMPPGCTLRGSLSSNTGVIDCLCVCQTWVDAGRQSRTCA